MTTKKTKFKKIVKDLLTSTSNNTLTILSYPLDSVDFEGEVSLYRISSEECFNYCGSHKMYRFSFRAIARDNVFQASITAR